MKIAFFALNKEEKEYVEKQSGLRGMGAEIVFYDHVLDKDNIPDDTDFEIASFFINSTIEAGVLEKLPNLQFIVTRSTGYDHINLDDCKKRNIVVANVPSYGVHTVAEFTFGLILTLSRKIYDAYDQVREKGDFSVKGLQGFDLKDKTLGVIGIGNIGRNVVKIAKGFGMEVLAFDVKPDEEFSKEVGFRYCSIEELLKESDIVTLHVPYLPSTHHLISKDNIYLMKKGAYLINTSRGPVVETEALVKALKDGHLGGAGLDVLEEEGVIKDEFGFLLSGEANEHDLRAVLANHILIDMPNVIVTPHNAFNTAEAWRRILDTTVQNIKAIIEKKPINTVG